MRTRGAVQVAYEDLVKEQVLDRMTDHFGKLLSAASPAQRCVVKTLLE